MTTGTIRTGIAGWSIGSALAAQFPGSGSHLSRYAARLNAAEINSSFHRPHRRATYEKWAGSVPPDFCFAVKLPKTITHKQRLVDCDDLLARFAEESGGLGEKRGPILAQLPPSFAFAGDIASRFLTAFETIVGGPMVLEPRHASWFEAGVEALLVHHRVARVAADPAPHPGAGKPGGWTRIAYFRLHGSPRVYWSTYAADAIEAQARHVKALDDGGAEVWTIYDNTASGAALANALELDDRLSAGARPQ
ncbi:MAG: DUF72 domain-containing protein [Sphingomonas sp.]